MANLTRWDPFEEMERLTTRYFEPFLHWRQGRQMTPAVDIFETDKNIELRVELPGLKPEDVKIDLSENTLTLSGERKLEHEEKREGYHRIERSFGSFSRSFTLPRNVDKESIQAEMKSGVLCLTLPKREAEKPQRISVRSLEEETREKEKEQGKQQRPPQVRA